MCRLTYLPANFRPSNLTAGLRQLEKSMGGHGNGLATPRYCRRGIRLSCRETSRYLRSVPHVPALWHTRWVSCGPMRNDLCHPFPVRRGEKLLGHLVHNGHWLAGADAAALLPGHWSDTRVAAEFIGRKGWDSFVQRRPTGVWLYLTARGDLHVQYTSGTLYENEDGILASEPVHLWGGAWWRCKTGTYAPGDIIPEHVWVKIPAPTPTAPTGFTADEWSDVQSGRSLWKESYPGVRIVT